ncbi:purine-nucleoside phosphorylase, partial [Streptococcus pyogenes]
MSLMTKINETKDFLVAKGIEAPEFGLILGSGLGELAEEVENPVVIDYADIPNWGKSTVVGHAGKLVYGDLAGRKVLALQGRFHFYEGNPLEVVTFPVRVMKALGCEGVLVTNAAGGIGY